MTIPSGASRWFNNLNFTGFAGLASHGAAIAIILTMLYIQKRVIKRSFLWILDRIVIPVSLGAIFIRLGNFFNSEIVGTKTDSAFGIQFLRDKWYLEFLEKWKYRVI